jgi:hypothetical protein
MFDTTVTVYGYSALTLLVIGLVIFLAGTKQGRTYTKVTPSTAKALRVIGVLTMLVTAGATAGWSLTSETASVASTELLVTAADADSDAFITIDNADREVKWSVHFAYASDGAFLNSTDSSTINFSVSRADTSDDDIIVKLYIADKGSVVDESAGKTYTLVNKGTDWSATWVKRGSVAGDTVTITGDTATLSITAGGSGWVTLATTLNADACDSMPLYSAETFYIDIGGVTFTYICQVINYSGSPPA